MARWRSAGVVAGVGTLAWPITMAAILVAVTRRGPRDRPRNVPHPLTASIAMLFAASFAGPLSPDTPSPVVLLVAAVGILVGAVVGRPVATAVLESHGLRDLEVPALPADSADSAGSVAGAGPVAWAGSAAGAGRIRDRCSIASTGGQWANVVWAGRLPGVAPILLPALVAVGAMGGVLASPSGRWLTVTIEIPVIIVLTVIAYFGRRGRVTVGPSGVRIHSGFLRRIRLGIPMDRIAGASTTMVGRRVAFSRDWREESGRLTVVARPGPALCISITDGSEVVVVLADPEEPAEIINRLRR